MPGQGPEVGLEGRLEAVLKATEVEEGTGKGAGFEMALGASRVPSMLGHRADRARIDRLRRSPP
jgi:hypothetical protein